MTRINGKRPQTQQQPIPPMQETYPMFGIEFTDPAPDGSRALIVRVPAPNKIMILPMDKETVAALCDSARTVEVSTPAQMAEAARKAGLTVPGR